jgi:hypothetical protein
VKKRSRLNLSSETKQHKTQASGFESQVPPESVAKAEVKAEAESGHKSSQNPRSGPRGRQDAHMEQQPSGIAVHISGLRSSRALMVTAGVVAAAAIFAFYIIRRR